MKENIKNVLVLVGRVYTVIYLLAAIFVLIGSLTKSETKSVDFAKKVANKTKDTLNRSADMVKASMKAYAENLQ